MAYDDIGGQVTGMLEGRDAAAVSGDNVTQAKNDASSIRSVAKDGQPPVEEKALVDEILGKIKDWKKHHKEAFEKMKKDVRFASNKHGAQWNGSKAAPMKELYVAQITFRHIQSRTSVLYAKNPSVKAKRRKRLDFKIWDGTQQQLDQAKQALDAANGVPPPQPPPSPEMVKVQAQIELEKAKTAAQIALLNAQTQLAQAQAGIKQQEAQAKAAADQTEHALQIEAARLSSIQEMKQTQEKHQNDIAIAKQNSAVANKIALEKHNHEMQVARDKHAQDLKIAADKHAQDTKLKAAQASEKSAAEAAPKAAPAPASVEDKSHIGLEAVGKGLAKMGEHMAGGLKAVAEAHAAPKTIVKGADGSYTSKSG